MMIVSAATEYPAVDPRRRWIRIIGIMDACEWCTLTPVSTQTLHTIAYLAEALAPIWSMDPIEPALIKQAVSPYYPNLQSEVDRLVGTGVIKVTQLRISSRLKDTAVLRACYQLNRPLADRILGALHEMPDEASFLAFLNEVVQAFSRLADDQASTAMAEDATYGDPSIDTGEVIDLGEWVKATTTPSARAARYMQSMRSGDLSPAETIDLYLSHLIQRVTHAVA